jgi:hypothetical protein
MEIKLSELQGSIHDASPYLAALRMNDAAMLSEPSLQHFTLQYWYGLELQQLWGAGTVAPSALRNPSTTSKRFKSGARAPVSAWKQAGNAALMLTRMKSRQVRRTSLEISDPSTPKPRPIVVVCNETPATVKLVARSSTTLQDPLLLFRLLQNMGLASRAPGGGPAPAAAQLAFLVVLGPRAFYNSPRGQWYLHCCIELLFLINYQASMQRTGTGCRTDIKGGLVTCPRTLLRCDVWLHLWATSVDGCVITDPHMQDVSIPKLCKHVVWWMLTRCCSAHPLQTHPSILASLPFA